MTGHIIYVQSLFIVLSSLALFVFTEDNIPFQFPQMFLSYALVFFLSPMAKMERAYHLSFPCPFADVTTRKSYLLLPTAQITSHTLIYLCFHIKSVLYFISLRFYKQQHFIHFYVIVLFPLFVYDMP